MTVTTKTEIHQSIVAALGDRARLLRKDAASRRLAGPAKAEMRKLIRIEAQRCEDLQRVLSKVSADKLAAALEA